MSGLHTPICDLFQIETPIFLAGMGGVAYADVCAAVSEAGGYGTLGMAGAAPEAIREEMQKVRALTDKPFGVDLLAALPDSIDRAADVIIEEGRCGGGTTRAHGRRHRRDSFGFCDSWGEL